MPEAQKMENKKRLINANEFLNRLNNCVYDLLDTEGELGYSPEIIKAVLGQTNTVDAVEVVHGRWEDGDCTACGFDIRDLIDGESDFRNWVWEGLPYCPNCGAKMDGGKDNETL